MLVMSEFCFEEGPCFELKKTSPTFDTFLTVLRVQIIVIIHHMTSYVGNMPVLHYMKLNFFNTRCFSITSHLATRIDTNFLATLEVENVAPEVLRRHGLHARKHDVVDARQRHPQEDPIGQWDGVLVHHQHVLQGPNSIHVKCHEDLHEKVHEFKI